MSVKSQRWWPALVLTAGCGFLLLSQGQRAIPLTTPLTTLPQTLLGAAGRDVPIAPEEQRIAGMSSFVLRAFGDSVKRIAFSVYVGYYASQQQGRSIHSPKNCLPGAGWEPLSAGTVTLTSPIGSYRVNRYVLANNKATALVYYWYQGRGRIQANEYAVKWDLLRDKALHGRSEEALVRIVVPIANNNVVAADSVATQVGRRLVEEVEQRLPEFPGRSLSEKRPPIPGKSSSRSQ